MSVEQTDLQSLSQLRPRQRPISSQNKAISVKDDCSTMIALFLCRGRGICCVMETRPYEHPPTVKYNVLVLKS